MTSSILGIHHVTAMAGDPQQNINFYTKVLGLRLVKVTINYDDPTTYHFYYGDGVGSPGSIITFFPWIGAVPGKEGTGLVTNTAFAVPHGSLPFWENQLRSSELAFQEHERFGESHLTLRDPDGLSIDLVEVGSTATGCEWTAGGIPIEAAIRTIHSVTLTEDGFESTAALLTETLGYGKPIQDGNRHRFALGNGGPGNLIDVVCAPGAMRGSVAVGSVHHVALRVESEEAEVNWRQALVRQFLNVSPVMDRQYFRSIYFREPGGVLFEIATDPPGFAADETVDELGGGLSLPSWLQEHRSAINARLPKIVLPNGTQVGTR